MVEANGKAYPRLNPLADRARREALVGELRALVASGRYEVDPAEVAAAVLSELAGYGPFFETGDHPG